MIVGCDYSTKAIDLAQHGEGQNWRHTKLHVNGLGEEFLRQLEQMLIAYWRWGGGDEPVIYIEQPWIGNSGKGGYTNPMTSMALIKVSTAVQVIAIMAGYRVEWAHPSSWRSKILPKQRYTKAQAKAASKAWATSNTGLAIVEQDDNAADACCIAAFGELREQDGG